MASRPLASWDFTGSRIRPAARSAAPSIASSSSTRRPRRPPPARSPRPWSPRRQRRPAGQGQGAGVEGAGRRERLAGGERGGGGGGCPGGARGGGVLRGRAGVKLVGGCGPDRGGGR